VTVLATGKGKQIKITANSVIIATGGYGGNKKLLKKYCPHYSENLIHHGVPTMGDGLLMATKIGAATEGLGTLHVANIRNVKGDSAKVMAVTNEPFTMWVNKRGERFMDEGLHYIGSTWFETALAAIRQPDSITYTVIDEGIKQSIIENGPARGFGPDGTGGGMPQPDLAETLQLSAERGNCKISNSLDEIAEWIGAKPEILKATVDEYNSFCDKGHDEIFAKERRFLVALHTPPYYALRCNSVFLGTIGGIKINHHMEVLDHEDNPIPGVYAAGIDTGGWESETYNYALSGSTFGFAINSGRIAGENAAEYVLRK
jgi:fumarate reductase flavoprotein subunit